MALGVGGGVRSCEGAPSIIVGSTVPELTIGDLRITVNQRAVLDLLEPGWLMVEKNLGRYGKTLPSMVKRGWIERRIRSEYEMLRLTRQGREVRDAFHIRDAKRNDQLLDRSKQEPLT